MAQSRSVGRTPLHQFAGTLSKWCREAIVPRRVEQIEEEEFSFGIDESMWDKNSMWFLDDENEVAECEGWDEWDEKAMLDITGMAGKECTTANECEGAIGTFESQGAEWNEGDIVTDSAEFDDASFYSDDETSYYSGEKTTRGRPSP